MSERVNNKVLTLQILQEDSTDNTLQVRLQRILTHKDKTPMTFPETYVRLDGSPSTPADSCGGQKRDGKHVRWGNKHLF